ncbi:MAG: hypothetical protein KDN05_05345 [Verrucomicrobiae bacterium]|nr:hypothetical protein [Verrucomicrobiae bacterium]
MESQSQPDAPLPPSSAREKRSRRWMWGIWVVGMLSVLGVASLYPLVVVKRQARSELESAARNLRSLGFGMLDFVSEYGSFPSDKTIAEVDADVPEHGIPLGTATSNDYFRQLIASGLVQSETIFHAGFTPRPDDVMIGSRALEKGECSCAYLRNIPASDPTAPVIVFPLLKGTLKADTKLCAKWGNKAAVLFVDNRVITLPVDASGRVIFKGRDLFDPAQPFWHGTSPDVVWPE